MLNRKFIVEEEATSVKESLWEEDWGSITKSLKITG